MGLFGLFAKRKVLSSNTLRQDRQKLRMEQLEARECPTVDLLLIPNSDFPNNKPLFVPITSTESSGPVTFTASSDNSNVAVELVEGGSSVRFTVSGKGANDQPFTGEFVIRLFESAAPLATGNIVTLVKNGYYDGKLFHRVVNDFVIQGGSPGGDGVGGSNLVNDVRDEFNPQFTFASRGIVAMANAGDDNNNAQFFITDPFILDSQLNIEVPAPLDRRSQFLNFNHTIVGILTSGFDVYQQIMNVPKVLGNDGAVSKPVTNVVIDKAEIIDVDDRNAVVKITALNEFLGNAKIQVTAMAGGSTVDRAFTVTSVVDTVNDRPFLGAISNVTTGKNTPANFTLPFVELDPGDKQTFAVGRVVNTANGPVFTTLDPAQATAVVDANGKVTVTPAQDFVGSFTLTVGVRDGQDRVGSALGLNDARNFDTEQITVSVTSTSPPPPPPANTPPTISNISDQSTQRDSVIGPIGFTVGDAETPVNNLTLTVLSSNPTLVPPANVIFGGAGSNRTVTITPAAGQTGAVTLTVTVTDGGGLTASDSFLLNVTVPPPPVPPTVTLTSTRDSVGVGRNVLFTATVTNGEGVVQFLKDDQVLGNSPVIGGKALLSVSFGESNIGEDNSIVAKFLPNSGAPVTSSPVDLTVFEAESIVPITATGSAAGTLNTVTVRNGDGSVRFTRNPYGSFTGVVRVKVGDVNNDGQDDVIVVPGFGGGPHIVVYDGKSGDLIFQRMIFEPHFRGGLSLDVGDAKGLGYDQILVGAGPGGGPRVTLLDAFTNKVLLNYFAYDSNNRGGVSVAMSDLRGGFQANIITGAGDGLAPNVNVYNPFQIVGFETPKLFGTFIAGAATNKEGIRVAAGPLLEDGPRRDILVGPQDRNDNAPIDQAFNPITLGIFVD